MWIMILGNGTALKKDTFAISEKSRTLSASTLLCEGLNSSVSVRIMSKFEWISCLNVTG